MGVYSVKDIIRKGRLKAGLTQEQASEGICGVQMLSKIETGRVEPSHNVFVALMERIAQVGESADAKMARGFFPAYADREEYEFYRALRYVWLYLGAWQLKEADEVLQRLVGSCWIEEPLYRQEWLLLQYRLQFCSCWGCHQQNYDMLLDALHLTRPEATFENFDFQSFLLSKNEICILNWLAQEAIYLGGAENLKAARWTHEQLGFILTDSSLSAREKERLQAEEAIVYAKYAMGAEDYKAALEMTEPARHKMAVNSETAQLLELTFLTGLCCWKTGNQEKAHVHIKAAFYTAQALECDYILPWAEYLEKQESYPLTKHMRNLLEETRAAYAAQEKSRTQKLEQWQETVKKVRALKKSEGYIDKKNEDLFHIGDLIRELRQEQNLPQQVLCQGLCSKSKLSKIENKVQEPDIMLAKILIRRLGLSDQLFTFYGGADKARFFELNFKVSQSHTVPKETVEGWLKEMEFLAEKLDNQLYRQECLFARAEQFNIPEEKITMLLAALHVTLPEFDIHKICDYRLSWCELSILNNIALAYRLSAESYLCTVYYSQILAYARAVNLDTLTRSDILPFTYYGYLRTLYLKKLYQNVLSAAAEVDMLLMKCEIGAYAPYLFFYSQALAECGRFEEAQNQALMACGLQNILEYPTNAAVLKQYFIEDFSIELEY